MFRYLLAVLCLCFFSCLLFAATGDEHTFELKWQEEGFFDSMEASLDRSEPFAKEPNFGSRDVLRGELSFGSSGHEVRMGFAWDKLDGKLYVDLNRDEDLTNDPNGVLESNDSRAGQYYNQSFPVFPLSFSTDLGVYHYRLRSFMQSYSGDYRRAEFRVNSGYSGKTELNGRQWRIEVNDKLVGMIQPGNKFSISPSDNPASNAMSSLPLPENIFIDGRCYEISFEFKKSESVSPSLWCTLREKTVSTGKLQIESKWVSQLIFGNNDILILPEPVEGIAIVPTGNYTVKQCNLKFNKEKPVISPTQLNEIKVTVSDNSENILRIGGPLKSRVSIQRTGKILKFDYELVGAGEEKYDAQQITQYDNEEKPSIAIYKGDIQLATGEFEYG